MRNVECTLEISNPFLVTDIVSHATITVLTAAGSRLPPSLESISGQATINHAQNSDDLRAHLPSSDVLLVTNFRSTSLQKAWPERTRLQWIHTASAGVDAVLIPQVVESDVVLTNARGIFDQAIAEYVLGVVLAFAKDTRRNIELQQAGKWKHRDTERIAGKRMLVVGTGAIGHAIARLCGAADMAVEGIARTARADDRDFETIHAIEQLYQRLSQADYVALAAPLTPDTRGMFDASAFAAMQAHARLINVGRGPIVDTGALVEALQTKTIAGAALDVFEQEPLPENHPLWRMSNVLISAHMAGDFIGWREALIEQFLDNFQRWQSGQSLLNIVDKQHR